MMYTTPEEKERFLKLPVWAQEKMVAYVRDNERLEEENERLRNPDPTPTAVIHDPYGDGGRKGRGRMYLDPERSVRFELPHPTWPERTTWIDVRIKGDKVELQADSQLFFKPHVTNVVTVWVDRS